MSKRRLFEARSDLAAHLRGRFSEGRIEGDAMISDDGALALIPTATGAVTLAERVETVPGWTTEEILAREG